MVKVSIVVPVYNVELYLEECLNSLINQTFKDIEIICVNDGSTDNSLNILNKYEKLDERIKVVSQENKGLSASRNHGVTISNGDYVYFMDSDDYLELTAIEELYDLSEKNNTDFIIFKMINFNDGSNEKFTSNYYEMSFLNEYSNKIFNYADLGEDTFKIAVSAPGKFFKKEFISGMTFVEGVIFEDNVFFTEAILKAKRVLFYNKHLYNRRIRDNSITTSKNIKFIDSIKVINLMYDITKEYGVYDDFKQELFVKKTESGYNRLTAIDDEYKPLFFEELKKDYLSKEKDFKQDLQLWNNLSNRSKFIFNTVIKSENYVECIYLLKNYFLKEEKKNLENSIYDLKQEIGYYEDLNNQMIESNKLKYAHFLRKLKFRR